MNWYYDSTEIEGTVAHVEVLYCFKLDDFTERDWQLLGMVYQQLPGQYRLAGVPHWYGTSVDAFHLWASVEPPGLQVAGTLPVADWLTWQAAFQALVQPTTLPRYEAAT